MRLTGNTIDTAIDAFIAHYKTAVDLDGIKIFDEKEVRRWKGRAAFEETFTTDRCCLYFWKGRTRYKSISLEKTDPEGETDLMIIPMQFLSNRTEGEIREDALQLQNSLVKKVLAMLMDARDLSAVQPFNYLPTWANFRWKFGDGLNGRPLVWDYEDFYYPGMIFPLSNSVIPDGWYASTLSLTLEFDNRNV